VELNGFGWKSPIALRALDRLGTAVIVTHGNGRVIELNQPSERILRQEDGLTVRNGRLEAASVNENSKLKGCIAAAATAQKTEEAIGRMRIGRRSGRLAYAVTVAPLGAELAVFDCPMAMILIGDPDERCFGARPRRMLWLVAGGKQACGRTYGGTAAARCCHRVRSSDDDAAKPAQLYSEEAGRGRTIRSHSRALPSPLCRSEGYSRRELRLLPANG
jgi:hypothetical protein